MAPLVIFIGPPGAGKTTVGKALAKFLAVDFTDSDYEIEKSTKKSITNLFEIYGESGFREIEANIVAEIIKNRIGVVALGAGAIMKTETRKLLQLQQANIVYLEVNLSEGVRRVTYKKTRPLFANIDDPKEVYEKILATRKHYYKKLANIHIRVNNRPTSFIVKQVARSLGYRE